MTRLKLAVPPLIAALAIGALACSSALASPSWYAKTKGTWAKVGATPVKVSFESNKNPLELIDTKYKIAGEALGISCPMVGEAKIKTAGAGELTAFKPQELEKCKGVKGKGGLAVCKKVESFANFGIPWKTELYSEGSEIRQRLTPTSEGGSAFRCELFTGSKLADECSIKTSTHMKNNTTEGLVEAEFETKSAKTGCSLDSEPGGEWKGVLKIKPTQGEKEAGVEAIKVE